LDENEIAITANFVKVLGKLINIVAAAQAAGVGSCLADFSPGSKVATPPRPVQNDLVALIMI